MLLPHQIKVKENELKAKQEINNNKKKFSLLGKPKSEAVDIKKTPSKSKHNKEKAPQAHNLCEKINDPLNNRLQKNSNNQNW